MYLGISITVVILFGLAMYFYSRKAEYRSAKERLKMRRNQIAIVEKLYEKALNNNPDLKNEIESQVKDFRNYQTSIGVKPIDDFDSIVYDADEEFQYLIMELKKYVDKQECLDLDKAYGTTFFS